MILASATLPGTAFAAGPWSGIGWFSQLFSWHVPVVSHVSSIFETRRDNVENNSVARNILLIRRHGSMTASSSELYVAASTSPSFLPYSLFKQKKAAIVTELQSALDGLLKTRADLSNLINRSSADGADMTAAKADFAQADTDIQAAQDAVAVVMDYEPVITGNITGNATSTPIDLSPAETGLDAATTAIQTERADLEKVIYDINISLRDTPQTPQ